MHYTACSDAGAVFTFGQNKYGQLGLGQTSSDTVPKQLQTLSDVSRVCSGRYHCAAMTTSGTLFMWGWGERGQLGQGDNSNQYIPRLLKELKDHVISDVACGDGHTVALSSNGIVYCWGDNSAGQLGVSASNQDVNLPRAVVTPSGAFITMVACGANFTAALAASGRVYTWGLGSTGQLGHGDNKNK